LPELEVLEVLTEEASIAGQEDIGFSLCVSTNEEIRDNAKPRPLAGRVMSAPQCSSQPSGLARERRKRKAEVSHSFFKFIFILKVSPHLRPDDITRYQRSAVESCAKRLA
jgi:hypothetical protein